MPKPTRRPLRAGGERPAFSNPEFAEFSAKTWYLFHDPSVLAPGEVVDTDDGNEGVRMDWTDRDFLIHAADLVLVGNAVLPERGDLIRETQRSKTFLYEVMAPGKEPPWRWLDCTARCCGFTPRNRGGVMLGLIHQLLAPPADRWRELLPVLRVILHSPALTGAVKASQSPIDELVLRVLRALVPQE